MSHIDPLPLASIVVATYRSRRDHLRAALDSALAQTWPRLEVIVSDDSPDDAVRELVAGIADPRLRYLRNAPPLGVACNHWQAFAQSRGSYLAILNHDDWLAPEFVARLIAPMQRDARIAVAFCDHWILGEDGRIDAARSTENTQRWGRAGLAGGLHLPFDGLVARQSIPVAMGALFRRDALPAALPSDAGPAYDLWLAYLLCRPGAGAWYVDERLSGWRDHAANLSTAGGLDWLNGAATCWEAIAGDAAFDAQRARARTQAARLHTACAGRAWARGRRGDCLRHAWRALRLQPGGRALAALLLPILPVAAAPARWRPRSIAR